VITLVSIEAYHEAYLDNRDEGYQYAFDNPHYHEKDKTDDGFLTANEMWNSTHSITYNLSRTAFYVILSIVIIPLVLITYWVGSFFGFIGNLGHNVKVAWKTRNK
jgi:hypothetical protein